MKLDLPYLFVTKGRRRRYAYYRRGGIVLPLVADDGTKPDPDRASDAVAALWKTVHDRFEKAEPPPAGVAKGSLAHVIETYRASPEFDQLTDGTKRDYGHYLDTLKKRFGRHAVAVMPREFVIGLRDDYAATPRAANYIVAVLRLLLSFAEDRPTQFGLPVGWTNPARRPKKLKTGPGHVPWEEWQIDAYRKAWKVGTRERMAFELLINTGQRAGDVAAMARTQYGWATIDGQRIRVVRVAQQKGGERVEIPASRDLVAVMDPWLEDHAHIALFTDDRGEPIKLDAWRKMMRAAYDAAKLPDVTTHGTRYTAATVLLELGIDDRTIADVTGHRTMTMVRKYTEKRRRSKLAIARLDDARAARKRAATGKKGTPGEPKV